MYQYLIGAALSLFVSVFIITRNTKTYALKSLFLFGLIVVVWEISSLMYRTAPRVIEAYFFFMTMIMCTHMAYPAYLITTLSIREDFAKKRLLLIFIPIAVDTLTIIHPDYFAAFEFRLTEFGWNYLITGYTLPLAVDSVIYMGYLVTIILVLLNLIRKTSAPLLRKKYSLLLSSFFLFQILGILVSNALISYSLISPVFYLGGIFQFLTFLMIWYALSIKGMTVQLYNADYDFNEIYSSFLTEFYVHSMSTHLGENYYKFERFVVDSGIEQNITLTKNEVILRKKDKIDSKKIVENNLAFFKANSVDEKIIDRYLRVLNKIEKEMGWGFSVLIEENKSFLVNSDLLYGISDGKFLNRISQDKNIEDVKKVKDCLKLYKRILLPISMKICQNSNLIKIWREEISELMINNYGEISIGNTSRDSRRLSEDRQISFLLEKFNSFLSQVYRTIIIDSDSDVDDLLEKLKTVLKLNKNRAISLGIYPTLLGSLATRIPKAQIHKLYSDYLEEMIEDKTKKLREVQESLLKSQRLAAIGEASAMVGHDLRNPLQAIVNTLYLAEMIFKINPNPAFRKLIKSIGEQVDYMNKIVSDLQDYARPIQLNFAETNLREILEEVLSSVVLPDNIKSSSEIERDFQSFYIDRYVLKRIIINLVTNSIQAMPKGGTLTIRVLKENSLVLIIVEDSGIGIPEENLDQIFKPLFTTKSKGQGLGLPVCARLVEALEGSISVRSRVGEGTKMIVKIPFKPRSSLQAEEIIT